MPKKNDIIKYVKNDYWVTAKVLSRARGNWFNLLNEDGSKGGVTLNLPRADFKEGWSLLPSEVWQQDQLRITRGFESREPSQELNDLLPDEQGRVRPRGALHNFGRYPFRGTCSFYHSLPLET